nr:hypothetical protein HmN_000976400 [Hymenolepis microstoma]
MQELGKRVSLLDGHLPHIFSYDASRSDVVIVEAQLRNTFNHNFIAKASKLMVRVNFNTHEAENLQTSISDYWADLVSVWYLHDTDTPSLNPSKLRVEESKTPSVYVQLSSIKSSHYQYESNSSGTSLSQVYNLGGGGPVVGQWFSGLGLRPN